MADSLRIALAQINLIVGDIKGNAEKVLACIETVQRDQQADLIVFPELTLTGYPPEDLLLRNGLMRQVDEQLQRVSDATRDVGIILGYPLREQGKLYNVASYISSGNLVATYKKRELPNYSVFDERRYFQAGNEPCVIDCNGFKLGLTICEDIWYSEPAISSARAGAEIIVNLNASPFHLGKLAEREIAVAKRTLETGVPVVYVNLVGGQDELVFDGASFVMDREGYVAQRMDSFVDACAVAGFTRDNMRRVECLAKDCNPHLSPEEAVYRALVMGVRDYVQKSGFKGVIIGLSGGIDSALTLLVAVDALGSENVETVMMPSRYTADISLQDAQAIAQNLDVRYSVVPIESTFKAFTESLRDEFTGYNPDVTEENIQARCRGTILMAISNKKGKMVLTTGNKSEMAVGYSTLYGDMAGGFDVLKDVPKTLVYRLAHYCNRNGEVIPHRIIERPPSAELRPDQTDQDSLPDYAILDQILEKYVEHDKSIRDIVADGFDEATVRRVVWMIDKNEYKRRQAPPGVRITPRAFGKDRRYPIVSGFSAL